MAQPYETAHIVGRLAGEDPGHPRQKIVAWLREESPADIPRFNEAYEQTLARDAARAYLGKDVWASYEAFGVLPAAQALGGIGSPDADERWAHTVGPLRSSPDPG